jgi:trehalose 6-phosphate synthase
MNLVAKEYVAAQDLQDPGVLILSKFAGAAEELTDALLVNPNDKVEVAEAIQQALHMSQEERVARWQAMLKVLWGSDVSRWAAAFIKDLAANKATRARRRTGLAKESSGQAVTASRSHSISTCEAGPGICTM